MRKRVFKRVVTLALLGAITYLIATRDGLSSVSESIERLRGEWVALALLLPLVAVAASVRRWQLLLQHEGIALPFGTLLASFLKGRFVGAFTPSTTGLDLYRLVDIGRRTGKKAASGRAILVEKLFGLVALALVTVALLPAGLARFFGGGGLLLALGLGGGSMLGLALLSRPESLRSVVANLPKKIRRRAHGFVDVIATRPLSRSSMMSVLSLGLVSHGAAAAIFLATGMALDLYVEPFALLVVGNAIVLATLLPISVGGVGVREGTAVVLLATVGVTTTDAALMAMLGYLAMQPAALAGGLLGLRPETSAEIAIPIVPVKEPPTITLAGFTPVPEAPLLAQSAIMRTASSTSAGLPM